ncbi:unnamed protein product [Orchesella dallaii]|uniref:CRAL-TRIO domain-containing protein n=1 Tax=Orchesella dallaii TaxID=48710 RepID=A0ABP1PRJ2_9HEXA
MRNKKPSTNSSKNKKIQRLKQKAFQELNEKEDEKGTCLDQLRILLQEEELLHCPQDDKFLLRFLRARKFEINNTMALIKRYYDMRLKNTELFENLCPESISHVLSQEIQIVLEKRDSQQRHVFLFRAGKWNPDIVSLDDIFRSNYIFLEEMTSSEETQICGVTAIVDFDGMGFNQARQFTPRHAIRMVQIIQNSFPCRFQEFHMINQPYVFNLLFSVVKPFLSEKIKKRIYFHGRDLTSLHKKISPEILPEFLGGSAAISGVVSKFNKKLLKNNQQYKDMCQYGYGTNKGQSVLNSIKL